jgi:hypothetical protein
VGANDSALVGGKERRKSACDFKRAGLELVLQAGRQSPVAFELPFKAEREIAVALGHSGRQAGAVGAVVGGDELAILGRETVFLVAATWIFAVALLVLLVALGFALAVALGPGWKVVLGWRSGDGCARFEIAACFERKPGISLK